MVTEAVREMTVRISEKAAKRIEREAKRLRQPPAEVAAQMLDEAVKMGSIELENELLLSRMSSLSTAELRERLQARLTDAEQERLAELLDRNRSDQLSQHDESELDDMLDRVQDFALQRATALVLLRDRSMAG